MEENKKKIKTFGKVLYVLAIIARICMYIGAVVLCLVAFVIPLIFSKIEIGNNRVTLNGISDSPIVIVKENDKLNMIVKDQKVDMAKELDDSERLGLNIIFDKLSNTTKGSVIAYIEAACILGIANLIILTIALMNLEKFCKSLSETDKVFTDDKPTYLTKAAIFFVVNYAISLFSSGVLNGLYKSSNSGNTLGIIEILVLFLASYIFAYGAELENKKVEVLEVKTKAPKATKTSAKKTTTTKKTTTKKTPAKKPTKKEEK